MPTFNNGESAASVRTKINDAIEKVDGTQSISSVDINGGSIDGVTIGGASAGAGTFSTATVNGNITVTGTVDGRDIATDGSKLDGIEALADVTDTANVTAAGALMDSEVTNLAAVKALNQGVATTDSPSFAGLTATSADINGGTIDGTVIGGTTAAAISGTTGQFGTSLNVDGTVTADGLVVDGSIVLDNASAQNISFTNAAISPIISSVRALNIDIDSDDNQGFTAINFTHGSGAGTIASFIESGDISFYEDTGTTPKFYWDASAERLGIGTDSPAAKLDVSADALIHGATVGRGAGAISTNTAVGSGALSSNTTGFQNTANGRDALQSNTTGNNNTANGRDALQSNTTGSNNTANGRDALRDNTTGSNNTANGFQALLNNTTGSDNTANGHLALLSNTTGDENTANGRQALQSNTTGSDNTANGRSALLNNTTGNNNTANGRQALQDNTTGNNNTANGFQALRDNTTGNNNTANGLQALRDSTTGVNNIGIGLNAGRSTSPRTITTASNEICIGNNDHTGAFIKIAFTVTSDARDKAELAPIPHGLDFVNALQPTEYQFKAGGRDGEADGIRRYGFLAQDVLAAEGDTPVIVNNDDPDSLKMTHDYLIPVLVNAVKELTAQVNDLMAEVAALKGQ